ncbi:MAG: hypothetical protein QOI66_5178, partial [Myxococcales bacterium]|nr:hypothetical protein [Myxococcales bacterium]
SNASPGWMQELVQGAYSYSPDVLVGYHKTTEWAGPWADSVPADLQWNGGGSNYGCWE